eukprot:1182585-Prorocentrum_minimum.AAC.1
MSATSPKNAPRGTPTTYYLGRELLITLAGPSDPKPSVTDATTPIRNGRARHGHCKMDRQDLVKPSRRSKIQLSLRFFTDAVVVESRALRNGELVTPFVQCVTRSVKPIFRFYNSWEGRGGDVREVEPVAFKPAGPAVALAQHGPAAASSAGGLRGGPGQGGGDAHAGGGTSHARKGAVPPRSAGERPRVVRRENIPALHASDWSAVRIYPRFASPIGPP